MKILQGAAFTALLVGAAGVTGPDGAIQPAAVVLVVVIADRAAGGRGAGGSEVINMRRKKMSEHDWSAAAIEILGYDREKIGKAVEACVQAMSELTIEESKIARKSLGHTLDEMYKRNPDTKISAILGRKNAPACWHRNRSRRNNSIRAL